MSQPGSNPSDHDLLATSTFHDWWLSELRSSIAPTAADVEPTEPPRQPDPKAERRPETRGKLLFACTTGLFWGAAMIVLIDGASETTVAAAPTAAVTGVVEVGEIRVMNAPASDEPAPPFDRQAAARALEAAAQKAASCAPGKRGSARVQVHFSPTGRVEHASVVQSSLPSARVSSCISERMRELEIPAFSGDDVIVKKTVRLRRP